MFFALLSFSSSLATKCVPLNDEPCIVRPTLIDLNPECKYYPFMISLDQCNGSCNVLSPKLCVITYLIWLQIKMKLKQWKIMFHVILNANLIVQHVIQIKNGTIKDANVYPKNIVSVK